MTRFFAAVALCVAASIAHAQPPLSATDAWVRAAPPGTRVMAGYLTLHNRTRQPVTLVAVESPRFDRVEMHRSRVVDGVARMQAVEGVEIPRRGSVALEPGGLHLMLVDPIGTVRDGDTIDLVLTFDNGWEIDLSVPVRRP